MMKKLLFIAMILILASFASAYIAPIKPISPVKIVTITTTTTTLKQVVVISPIKIVPTEPVDNKTEEEPDLTVPLGTIYEPVDKGIGVIKAGIDPGKFVVVDGVTIINLICPNTDQLNINWPDEPYDFSGGDCASLGMEAEIEEWINDMFEIAEDCVDSVDDNIQDFYEDKQDILDYLVDLPERQPYEPPEQNVSEEDLLFIEIMAQEAAPSLPMFDRRCSTTSSGADFETGSIDDGTAYTGLLESMIEAVNKTCTRATIINDNLVCFCQDVADYINGKTEVWPEHKSSLVHMFNVTGPNLQKAYNGSNTTFNWFMHLNNSWHQYYNPSYINCMPDVESAIPHAHIEKIAEIVQDMDYTPEEPGKGVISKIMNMFGFGEEEDDEEEPE
ncbi:hypothetical protein KY312_01015 [Candidatus Woesearchaeota archaeon]|nr:hypothetical protein [Candidatus Woesearchaeota archaeon]